MKQATSAEGLITSPYRETAQDTTQSTGQQRRNLGIGGLFRATYYAPKQGALSDLQLRYLGLLSQRIDCH